MVLFRTVYESRGNRKGNQAFYERPRHPILDIQYSKNSHLYSSHCKAILAAVRHPSLSSQMIDYLWIKDGNARNAFSYWAFYEAVAAGNRSVAASIAAVLGETWGLNKVHLDVLKVDAFPIIRLLCNFPLLIVVCTCSWTVTRRHNLIVAIKF
jgi:hypothetical protein